MRKWVVGFVALTVAIVPVAELPAQSDGDTIAIVGATVFDGTGAAPKVETVILRGGRIAAVGPDLKLPRGAKIVDARGKALLPGLFDVHTHWTPGGTPATTPKIATAYVMAGVTTVNDFHEQPESFAPRRAWLASLASPHVNFAARISTPGGHGADWADQATTIWINTPEAARAAIETLKPYKPDLIKAFTDGWRYGLSPNNTSMDEWTLAALSDGAHEQGWPVLTHTVAVERGLVAARGHADSLAHGLQDREITAEEVAAIKASGMGMAPTLAVYDPDKPRDEPVDPESARYKQSVAKFGHALHNVKALYDAGVPIFVGTDAGMPGTPHGKSTLHELELLVKAGLTPSEALVAGTLASAQLMRMDADRGTIAPGKRADLLLVDGAPWEDISDIFDTWQVYVDGRLVSGHGAPPLPAGNAADFLPSVTIPALVDDFERADRRSTLDTLHLETGDGGMDRTVEIAQVVARADGGHALALTAKMAMKDDAYAGFAVPLTRGSVTPVDLRRFKGVRFQLRGEGEYVLRLNGMTGSWEAPVTATRDWQVVEVDFADLRPMPSRGEAGPAFTGDELTQVEIGGSRPAGQRLWLQADDITFY